VKHEDTVRYSAQSNEDNHKNPVRVAGKPAEVKTTYVWRVFSAPTRLMKNCNVLELGIISCSITSVILFHQTRPKGADRAGNTLYTQAR
jgi:hypothetical protein